MKKEIKFIDCGHCSHWDDLKRYYQICHPCNNTRKKPDPTGILCNMCGECMCPEHAPDPHGLLEAKVVGGYNSYHLFDCTRYTFNLCEKCLRNLFDQCKIPPDVADMMGSGDDFDYNEDKRNYEYRLWQDNGGHHQAYMDRKCNFVKDCPNRAEYTQLISRDFTENCCCEEHKDLWGYGNSNLTKFIPHVLKPFL